MSCGVCAKAISKSRSPGVQCTLCNNKFHVSCVNLDSSIDLFTSGTCVYYCSTCKAKHRKSIAVSAVNANMEDQNSNPENIHANQLTNSSIYELLQEIKSSQQFLSEKYDATSTKLDKFASSVSNIAKENQQLKNENKILLQKLNDLQDDVWDLKQHEICNDIVIKGVPLLTNETSLQKIVENTFLQLKVGIDVKSVSKVYRIAAINVGGKSKPSKAFGAVVVKCSSSKSKELVMNSKKNLSKAFLDAIAVEGFSKENENVSYNIYANDHLTSYNSSLFNMARVLKHKGKYQYVWTKDCKVFVKKDESSRGERIRKFEQLSKIFRACGLEDISKSVENVS